MLCPDAKEQQAMPDVVGTGPDAVENAVKFYSNLYGKPLRESKTPDGVALQWIDPETAKLATPIALNIIVRVGVRGKLSVSCGLTF
jgi:hypothetical protein